MIINQPSTRINFSVGMEQKLLLFSCIRNKLILLLIFLILIIPLISWLLGMKMGRDDILKKYLIDIADSFSGFLVDTYVATVIHGQVVTKENDIVTVKMNNQSITLPVTEVTLIIKGHYDQGPDMNSKAVNFSELKVGDEVYSEGYYSPENRYVIPDYILTNVGT